MVVDDPARLHQGIRGRRADEAKAAELELSGQCLRLRASGLEVGVGSWRLAALRPKRPHHGGERLTRTSQPLGGAGVLDRGDDLGAVPDDPLIAEQALHVGAIEGRNRGDLKPREGGPEGLALAEDRQPGESALEGLEGEPLIEATVVKDGTTPFQVVVPDVLRRRY